jgi:hypothetical protein
MGNIGAIKDPNQRKLQSKFIDDLDIENVITENDAHKNIQESDSLDLYTYDIHSKNSFTIENDQEEN